MIQTFDFTESAPNPQTESKRNTPTTTINLHRVIFDNITISTITYKDADYQIHIKYTYRLSKGGICVEVKSEEQKQL